MEPRAETTVKLLAVPEQMACLGESLSSMEAAIQDLNGRLVPLLRPEPQNEECSQTANECICPLCEDLISFIQRIDALSAIVHGLLSHLEI